MFKDFVNQWIVNQWDNYHRKYTFAEAKEKLLTGAHLYFFEKDSTRPACTYMDSELTTIHCHPIIADSRGHFLSVYFNLNNIPEYTCRLANRNDEILLITDILEIEKI